MKFGVVRFPGSCDEVDAQLAASRVGDAVPPAVRSEIVERAAPSAIAPPTENALLIRWSTPSDMSLLESPLRIAAISSEVRLKPRSAAAGSD